jgi:ABC-type branched-subunit amino acid transport system ATPase component
MHGIGQIEIENFRICRRVSMPLGPITPLVGQNNSGKSTVLEAIRIVLNGSSLAKGDAADATRPITIAARIDGIDQALLDTLPDPRHRTAIKSYCVDGSIWIRIVGPGKTIAEIWDPSEGLHSGIPAAWRAYPTGIPAAVKALLPETRAIGAMEDVEEDLAKGRVGSTIRGLLDDLMAPVLETHAHVAEALDSIRQVLAANGNSRSPLLVQFDQEATSALQDFFPGLSVDIDVPIVEVKELFKTGDIYVMDDANGERRSFSDLGTGAQRALQMALVRMLADRQRRSSGGLARRVLLIDEPELFLHPQAVVRLREALRALSAKDYQVVFATHSPLMVSRDNAPDTVVVRRTQNEGTTVRLPLRQAIQQAIDDAPSQARILFGLESLAEIYFCERVIICEGPTDQRLLPFLLRNQRPGLESSMRIVSVGGCAGIRKAMLVLGAMGIDCVAVADLDFGFTSARAGNNAWLLSDDPNMTRARQVLLRLKTDHGCTLGENGLPQGSTKWPSWKTWSKFASDAEGREIANAVHSSLLPHGVWIWPLGCIEDVLGITAKGEEVVLGQLERLRQLSPMDITERLPAIQACIDWLTDGRSA